MVASNVVLRKLKKNEKTHKNKNLGSFSVSIFISDQIYLYSNLRRKRMNEGWYAYTVY